MPNTYTQLLYHVVFATRRREPLILERFDERLHAYIGGIVRGEDGVLLAAGGMPDHLHLVISLGTTRAIADVVRTIKSKSALWLNELEDYRCQFYWQRGYSAFTVSMSQLDKVIAYVRNQKEHHAKHDYLDELRLLLSNHGVHFEEQYLAD